MTDLDTLGWDDGWSQVAAQRSLDLDGIVRVTRQDRGWVNAVGPAGSCTVRARQDRVGVLVPGDWLAIDDSADDATIADVLPRRTLLRRAAARGEGAQALAANVDIVVIVAGLDRPVKDGRIHRALTQVHDAGADPLILLTKADTVDAPEAQSEAVRQRHPGVEVLWASAVTGAGLGAVRDRLRHRTIVLIGESGAGKSTLVNALAGSDRAAVGDVRAGDRKGRHTTTHRELHPLGDGLVLIDTPGIRSLGVYGDPASAAAAFPDVDALAAECRFSDCSHDHEPGCAVRAAADGGDLDPERLRSYLELRAEMDAVERDR